MPVAIGLDVGTTTIGALALDAATGTVLAAATVPNDCQTTGEPDRARGRSEWDAARLSATACASLRACSDRLGPRASDVVGLALTGQQHGVVVVDAGRRPLTPFINWQDRRGEELVPDGTETWVQHARSRAGEERMTRTGCRLATGFMGTTLLWLKANQGLPADATACFITDYVGATLTGQPPVTDPTMGASSGLFDLEARTWHDGMTAALGLPRGLFPPVGEAGDRLGELSAAAAEATGLPPGLPVFVGLGDNQASFLGSVADLADTVLVNVGTGAQVARYTDRLHQAPPLETRPFARSGYLLVHAGLSGGHSYAVLERFFRAVARDVLGAEPSGSLYERMNALAQAVPPGADGLRCDPFFAGSRREPDRRASWAGVSDRNLTPGHLIRSVLEGMARGFREGYDNTVAATGCAAAHLVGAGNGLRENALLAQMVADEFGLPLAMPAHREEAAYGAALVAGVGAGLWPDLAAAARVIDYGTTP